MHCKDRDAWLEEAERKFEERIDLMEAIINGKMGPENMTYADMVVMELRVMDMLRVKYEKEGKHCVLDDYALITISINSNNGGLLLCVYTTLTVI